MNCAPEWLTSPYTPPTWKSRSPLECDRCSVEHVWPDSWISSIDPGQYFAPWVIQSVVANDPDVVCAVYDPDSDAPSKSSVGVAGFSAGYCTVSPDAPDVPSTPPVRVRPDPTVISSMAPVDAVVRPNSAPVDWV